MRLGHTLGLFAGSMTSTATLQAALDVMGNSEPSIGYSVAYPFGVIGPILCFYFLTRKVQPSFPPKPARFHIGEITIERLPDGGGHARRADGDCCRKACRSRRSGRTTATGCPMPTLELRVGDALMIAADSAAAVAGDCRRCSAGSIRAASPRTAADLSYQRFFVSKAGADGAHARRDADAGRHPKCASCTSAATTWTSCRRPT